MAVVKAAALSALVVAATLVSSTGYAAKPGPTEAAVPSGAITPPRPTLVWNKVAGAKQYQLQGQDQHDQKVFATKVLAGDARCVSRPFCRSPAPEPFPFGPNKWRVRAGNGDGWGPWSEWAEFWVGGPAVAQGDFVFRFPIVPGPQTVTSLTIVVPERGAVSVTSQGYLECTRNNKPSRYTSVTFVITDDPQDQAVGVNQHGYLGFGQPMAVDQSVSFNLSTTRVFRVGSGARTFYLRANGFSVSPSNDNCRIFSGSLTAEFFPYVMEQVEAPASASESDASSEGASTASRRP